MKTKKVKDLMVPLSEYATVSSSASLSEAVLALREAQEDYEHKYPHRAVLVLDDDRNVVGKISLICILRALEPKYDEMLSDKKSLHLGFTRQFQKSMLEQLRLWNAPMKDICKKAADIKVKAFMLKPTDGEYVDQNASLDEVIHLLVMGHHQSLLVLEGNKIVGVVRLTDVFEAISDEISTCKFGE